jgi:hypothetical protein
MRPLGYAMIALLLFGGSVLLPRSDAPSENYPYQMAVGSRMQAETLNQLVQDMQDLAKTGSLDPQQRAEIKSLLSQTRLLQQKLNNSPDGAFQPHHHKQLQEIKLRFDAIKNALPPRPVIRKLPTAIVRGAAASSYA